ncbi:MAG TPA: hypothetical protein PLB89_05405 [Flavobacteriales bacterium]|nr:hypothetical protein [Flavobacteriales bacterium]
MKALRKRLPRGFVKTALERLSAKGVTMTQPGLSQLFKGKYTNEVALKVLMRIADEHERKLNDLSLRARGKKKAPAIRAAATKNA